MTPDLLQYALYAGFVVLGWWLRHKGILGPRGTTPATPAAPADQKVVLDLLKSLLDRLATQPPPATPAPGQPAGHVITVPFEVAATPRVSA